MGRVYVSNIFSPRMLWMKRTGDFRHIIISTIHLDDLKGIIADEDVVANCPSNSNNEGYMKMVEELLGLDKCAKGKISLSPGDTLIVLTIDKRTYDYEKSIDENWINNSVFIYKMKVI